MIQGTVLAVIYQNPENGYCVLKVRTEQGEAVTVVGVIPMCVVGERLAIVGRWTRHQSFGQQFEAEFLERLMPETTSEILAFLSSRAVKGIGPKMAEKIVSRFGEKSLNVLEQDPMQLTQIPGISEKKAQEMSESFQKQSGIRRLIEFLTIYHLPAQLAVRLYRAYGELAQEALRDDPYLLTDSYYRADFSQVDAFAIALGVSADDERRVEAGILFELSYNLGAGHTFIPQDKLRTATCALLDLDGEMIDAGMLRLQEQGARYDVRLSRQQALPKVELGYKYEYGTGEHFNGFTAGLSIPILSNRHNVKRAHAMEQAAKANTESALAQQRSSVRELYLKVDYTGRLLESFGGLPDAAGYIDMLGRTLEAGQINIVDYYSELDTFYSALETRIRTDLEYRLGLARLNVIYM